MFNKRFKKIQSLLIIIVLFNFVSYTLILDSKFLQNEKVVSPVQIKNNEWIIKWNGEYQPEIEEQAIILDWLPSLYTMKLKLNENVNINEWLNEWKNNEQIVYIQRNSVCTINEVPNDKHYEEQYYLNQLNAEQGWDNVYVNEADEPIEDLIVAIVDTGVDLNHLDLKSNLVDGMNILNKEELPMDDNGHGTSVAGVVAAVSNNSVGITGVARNTKIMPVKVLDENGEGDPFFVGQGIRYAVDNGAKIILLSLGETIYTPFMSEAIEYANDSNVLVVAASGNNGSELNYPSELSTVLSVGAVDKKNSYVSYSNFGQQLDVVAYGEGIYTTALGGGYVSKSGTSLAAPQVAGLAVLIFHKYPHLTNSEVIDLIKFTTIDTGVYGWDELTGYGLINIEKALATPLEKLKDGYESNQTSGFAHMFPLEDTFNAELATSDDIDWYKIIMPYDGKLKIQTNLAETLEKGIELEIFTSEEIDEMLSIDVDNVDNVDNTNNKDNIHDSNNIDNEGIDDSLDNDEEISMEIDEIEQDDVNELTEEEGSGKIYQIVDTHNLGLLLSAGEYYIKIQVSPEEKETNVNPINYTIKNHYEIYSDLYEKNDNPWNAYHVENISKAIKGTFDKDYDEDWYKINIPVEGILYASIEIDTYRLDPVLYIQEIGKAGFEFDYYSSGKNEQGHMNINPGEYLIRVTDYNIYSVKEEYQLNLNLKTVDGDSYEPNNLTFQATEINNFHQKINGVIDDKNDYDWYKFYLDNRSYTTIDFSMNEGVRAYLFDENINSISYETEIEESGGVVLEEGAYYLRLDSGDINDSYNFTLSSKELIGGFIDIKGHSAESLIIEYTESNIIKGYEQYSFKPDQAITRLEAAQTINAMLELPQAEEKIFTDINIDSEGYDEIARTVDAGLMEGYSDNTFRPDEPLETEELDTILINGYNIADEDIKKIKETYNKMSEMVISRAEFILIIDAASKLPKSIDNAIED